MSVKVSVDVAPRLEPEESFMQELCTETWAGLRGQEARVKHPGTSNNELVPPEG